MKKVLGVLITTLLLPLGVQAGITTKTEAENILDEYCIELVSTIKDSYESQKLAIKSNDWKTFGDKGRWIVGVSDIYSKLCK